MSEATTARTYNQDHKARKYAKGRRRVSVYIAWSYPGEANRDLTVLDNRFSSMTEVRRVFWPDYEAPQWADPLRFQQGIAGSLELFFWAWVPFQKLAGEVTGHPVPVLWSVSATKSSPGPPADRGPDPARGRLAKVGAGPRRG